jgi:hypothetical protein
MELPLVIEVDPLPVILRSSNLPHRTAELKVFMRLLGCSGPPTVPFSPRCFFQTPNQDADLAHGVFRIGLLSTKDIIKGIVLHPLVNGTVNDSRLRAFPP